jgi:hypothetical protein
MSGMHRLALLIDQCRLSGLCLLLKTDCLRFKCGVFCFEGRDLRLQIIA